MENVSEPDRLLLNQLQLHELKARADSDQVV